jgi:hypothetical protein
MIENLCTPVILYLIFSTTQIIIDIFKTMYNTAILKFILMIGFTFVLNFLCERGLGIISWIIVFIPFIMMTIISSLLLFALGMSPSSGKVTYGDDSDIVEEREHNKNKTHYSKHKRHN